ALKCGRRFSSVFRPSCRSECPVIFSLFPIFLFLPSFFLLPVPTGCLSFAQFVQSSWVTPPLAVSRQPFAAIPTPRASAMPSWQQPRYAALTTLRTTARHGAAARDVLNWPVGAYDHCVQQNLLFGSVR